MVIVQEAGGSVTGSHAYYEAAKDLPSFGEPNEEILTGRKYLVVRAIGDSEVRHTLSLSSAVIVSFANLHDFRKKRVAMHRRGSWASSTVQP